MNIHLHRFGDKVAIAMIPNDGETVYLTPNEAIDLAGHLRSYVTNIRGRRFTESNIGNAEVHVPNPSRHHKDIER